MTNFTILLFKIWVWPEDTENILKISQTNYMVLCKIEYVLSSMLGRVGGRVRGIASWKYTCFQNFYIYEIIWGCGTICTILKNVKNTNGEVSVLVKAATLLKVTLRHECFSRFLNCTNGIKRHKASDIKKWVSNVIRLKKKTR